MPMPFASAFDVGILGIAAVVARHIVQQGADGRLPRFEVAGYVVVVT